MALVTTEWKPPKIAYIHCDYCEQQKPIPSQDREMDAILDEDGYFNVLDNTEEGNMPATAAVFKFLFCPICGRRLPAPKEK